MFWKPQNLGNRAKTLYCMQKTWLGVFGRKNCNFKKLDQKRTTQETLKQDKNTKNTSRRPSGKPFEKCSQKHEFCDPAQPVNLIKSEPESTCDFEADSGCANEASIQEHPRTMRKQSRTIEKHSKTIQDRSRNMQEHSQRRTK